MTLTHYYRLKSVSVSILCSVTACDSERLEREASQWWTGGETLTLSTWHSQATTSGKPTQPLNDMTIRQYMIPIVSQRDVWLWWVTGWGRPPSVWGWRWGRWLWVIGITCLCGLLWWPPSIIGIGIGVPTHYSKWDLSLHLCPNSSPSEW